MDQTLMSVETCPCGRVLHGFGNTAHLRHCETNLRERGWRLDRSMRAAILHEYRHRDGAAVLAGVERRLGRLVLARRAEGESTELTEEPRARYRELVWLYAYELAAEIRSTPPPSRAAVSTPTFR